MKIKTVCIMLLICNITQPMFKRTATQISTSKGINLIATCIQSAHHFSSQPWIGFVYHSDETIEEYKRFRSVIIASKATDESTAQENPDDGSITYERPDGSYITEYDDGSIEYDHPEDK